MGFAIGGQALCLGVLVSSRRTRAKERMPSCSLELVHLQAVSPIFGHSVCLQVNHLTRFLSELWSSTASHTAMSHTRFVINWTAAVMSKRKYLNWQYCKYILQVCFNRTERQDCNLKIRHCSDEKKWNTLIEYSLLCTYFSYNADEKLHTFTLFWQTSQEKQKPFWHCLWRISAGPFITACLF